MLNIVFASSELPAYISKEGKLHFLLREGCQEDACFSNQEGSGKGIEDTSGVHNSSKARCSVHCLIKAWGGACGRRDVLGLLNGGCWASLLPGSVVSPSSYLLPSVEMAGLWFWVGDFP